MILIEFYGTIRVGGTTVYFKFDGTIGTFWPDGTIGPKETIEIMVGLLILNPKDRLRLLRISNPVEIFNSTGSLGTLGVGTILNLSNKIIQIGSFGDMGLLNPMGGLVQ